MRRDPDTAEGLLLDRKAKAQDAVSDVRRLVHGLRPPALDDLGFVGALREFAARYDGTEMDVSVEVRGPLPPLPVAVEVAAYRIAQEAVANAARHAGARRCGVTLETGGGFLALEVRDYGRGMTEGARGGVGMHSMRERAAELGGRLAIEPPPTGGTLVRAELPLHLEG